MHIFYTIYSLLCLICIIIQQKLSNELLEEYYGNDAVGASICWGRFTAKFKKWRFYISMTKISLQ